MIITPVLYLIGGLLLFGLLSTWLGLTAGAVFVLPHMDFFTYGPNALGYVGMFNAVFALGIPLLVIVLSVTKHIFKFKVNKGVTISLIIFAVINFFSFVSIAGSTAKDFKVETSQLSQFETNIPDSDTIRLEFPRTRDLDQSFVINLGDDVNISDDELLVSLVDVNIQKSSDDQFSIDIKQTSRGNNSVASEHYLEYLDFDIKEDNGLISIPQFYSIAKGGKFRGQEVDVIVNIPAGRHIVFGKGVRSSMVSSREMAEGYKRNFRNDDVVWKMTKDGIVNNLTKAEMDTEEPHEVTISLSAEKGIDIEVKSDKE